MATLSGNTKTGGAASVPDATTVVAGKVRLATVGEATTGTSQTIAVTPAGLAASVAGIVGGMTYKGFFDAINAVPDLSYAEQGDFYKVSAAGTRFGQSWAVGDMLVINEDMGGTITNGKIDKIDNTESVLNLNDLLDVDAPTPSTRDVLYWSGSAWVDQALVAADVSGVATSAQLSAEAATRASADATLQANIDAEAAARASVQVELNTTQAGAGLGDGGAYTAPAGSNYLASASSLNNADSLLDAQIKAVSDEVDDLSGLTSHVVYVNDGVNDVQDGVDAATGANTLVWCSPGSYGGATVALNDKVLLKLRGEGAGTGGFGVAELVRGLTISGASSTRNLVQGFQIEGLTTINGTQGRHALIDCQLMGGLTITNGTANFVTVRDCEIAGAVTIAATVTAVIYLINCNFAAGASIANSALAAQVIVANCVGFPAAALAGVTMAGQSGLSDGTFRGFFSALSLPSALNFTGNTNQLTNGAGFVTAATAPVTAVNTLTGAVTLTGQNTTTSHTAANYTAATTAITAHLAGIDTALGTLGGEIVASVNGVTPVGGDVTLTPQDIAGFAAVATSGAYADLAGAPSLAAVATSGAYADLAGAPSLAAVATSGAYADLAGAPSLGTAAAEDVGTSVGDVVQLVDIGAGVAGLPAVDGSQLSGVVASASKPTVTSATPSGTYAITTYTGLEEVYVLTPSANTTVTLPAAASAGAGYRYRIKNMSTHTLLLDPAGAETIDGAATFSTAVQYASISLLSTGSAWIIV